MQERKAAGEEASPTSFDRASTDQGVEEVSGPVIKFTVGDSTLAARNAEDIPILQARKRKLQDETIFFLSFAHLIPRYSLRICG